MPRPHCSAALRRDRIAGAVLALGALTLGACDAVSGNGGPGGVSEGEARELDEAAQELDDQRLPADALPDDAPSAKVPVAGDAPAADPAPQSVADDPE